jgi:hypothetical protein
MNLTKKHHTESGIVIGLLFIMAGFYTGHLFYFKLTFVSLILGLIMPVIFYPFSFLWFNLSEKLGSFTSLILMSVIFAFFVIPVGLFRKLSGIDSLMLLKFKKDKKSVFKNRDTTFKSGHLDKTY